MSVDPSQYHCEAGVKDVEKLNVNYPYYPISERLSGKKHKHICLKCGKQWVDE